MWLHYFTMTKDFGEKNVFIVRYEDLKNIELRYKIIEQMSAFLYIPTTNQKISCAFLVIHFIQLNYI